jgi:ABC-2 type transport system permease protein
MHLSQIALGVLGALMITGEYSSGMIRTTFAAVPRRRTVLAAKGLVLTGVALAIANVSTVAAYVAFLATLPPDTLTGTALTDPGVARAVVGRGLYLTVFGLLGFGLGIALRCSIAAISTLLAVLFVPPLLLPGSRKTTVGPYIPMQSGSQIFVAARREAVSLVLWTGFGVFCLYALVALLVGFAMVKRRDA